MGTHLCNMAHGACCTTVVSGAMHLADKLENSGSVKAPQGGHCLTRRCDGGCKMSRSGSCFYISLTSDPKTCFMKSSSPKLHMISDLRNHEHPWRKLHKKNVVVLSSSVVIQGGQFWVPKRSRKLKEKDLGLLRCDPTTGLSKQTLSQILRVTHKYTTKVPHLNKKDLEGMLFLRTCDYSWSAQKDGEEPRIWKWT